MVLTKKQKRALALKTKAEKMAPWDVCHCPFCEKEKMRGLPQSPVFCSLGCEHAYWELMKGTGEYI